MGITGSILSTNVDFSKKYRRFLEILNANLLLNKNNRKKFVNIFIEIFAEPNKNKKCILNSKTKYTFQNLIAIAKNCQIPIDYDYDELKRKIFEKNNRLNKHWYNRPRFLTWNLKGFPGCYIDKKRNTDRGYEKASESKGLYISENPKKIARPNRRVHLPMGDTLNVNPSETGSQFFIGYLFNNPKTIGSNKIYLSFGVDNKYSLFNAFLAATYPDYLTEDIKSRPIIVTSFIDEIEDKVLDESFLRSLMNGELYLLLLDKGESNDNEKDSFMRQLRDEKWNNINISKRWTNDEIVLDLLMRLVFINNKYNIVIFDINNDNNIYCPNIRLDLKQPFIFIAKKNDGVRNR